MSFVANFVAEISDDDVEARRLSKLQVTHNTCRRFCAKEEALGATKGVVGCQSRHPKQRRSIMSRNSVVKLSIAAVLGVAVIVPTAALAHSGGGGGHGAVAHTTSSPTCVCIRRPVKPTFINAPNHPDETIIRYYPESSSGQSLRF